MTVSASAFHSDAVSNSSTRRPFLLCYHSLTHCQRFLRYASRSVHDNKDVPRTRSIADEILLEVDPHQRVVFVDKRSVGTCRG